MSPGPEREAGAALDPRIEAVLADIEARWDRLEPIERYQPVPASEIWDAVM